MNRKSYLNIWLWIIIIGIATGLRCLFLQYDIWYDEACSWFTAIQTFPMGILNNLLNLDLQHTPLYFFILHFWIKLFGDSEVALRSLSLIFGIATIPLAYIVSKKLTSKLNSVLIASIIAVAPLLVFFSVEIRMYSVVVFWILLSLNYLIDFEQKSDKKSLVKLVCANLLIPYTFVGGIFYNLSLVLCYGIYLFKTNREKFILYIKSVGFEFCALIPYFLMVLYYANMRSLFVIKREGQFYFFHLIDVIRNFFGLSPVINVYWPSLDAYDFTFIFTLLVVVPCVYFGYGYVQGFKNSKSFNKVLYFMFTLIFIEFLIGSVLQVNVFTSRYILYLLPPIFILSVMGLAGKISEIHLKIFVCLFFLVGIFSNINYSMKVPEYRTQAFKAVRLVADELELDNRDIVILPFGADAPYYFRDNSSPRVLPFDFHKEIRNPYNKNYYDEFQTENILKGNKAQILYDRVFSNFGFSESHFRYFTSNVNNNIEKGRYVLLALYGSDADAVVKVEDLRKSITSVQDVENRIVEIMLKKYLLDIRAYLDMDFYFESAWSKDNYTYLLFRKK